eukprot:TRINITY_DN336_c0_g1_i5.p1 TRINITY_DN336_c0_g1~~TRINITY_DN336_c0_g1_i5.p1  ORF type:complete len:265 (-),score=67.49 TRINITY_DN336_c0_g1_i5:62-856(-)
MPSLVGSEMCIRDRYMGTIFNRIRQKHRQTTKMNPETTNPAGIDANAANAAKRASVSADELNKAVGTNLFNINGKTRGSIRGSIKLTDQDAHAIEVVASKSNQKETQPETIPEVPKDEEAKSEPVKYSDVPTTFYPVDSLRVEASKLPKDVDPAKREEYLSDDDFKAVFGQTKAEFRALPKWRQAETKKKHNLFQDCELVFFADSQSKIYVASNFSTAFCCCLKLKLFVYDSSMSQQVERYMSNRMGSFVKLIDQGLKLSLIHI